MTEIKNQNEGQAVQVNWTLADEEIESARRALEEQLDIEEGTLSQRKPTRDVVEKLIVNLGGKIPSVDADN